MNRNRLLDRDSYSEDDTLKIRDRQVILNGLRVSLGEIEAIINEQPDIRDSYVRILDNESEVPRLIAYIVQTHSGDEPRRVQQRMKHILPMHLLPEQFVIVEEITRTPMGRVDEDSLSIPEPPAQEEFVSHSRGERFLLKLWKEILATESVGVDDDFYDLGGNDQQVAQMLAYIESRTAVKISIEQFQVHPTLRALAQHLDQARPVSADDTFIELRAGQTSPIFLIPAAARTSLSAMRYITRINEGIRVVGVEYPRKLPPLPAPQRVPSLAEYFVAQIRTIHPHGPYSLIGNCMGGILVYEIARQLRQAGQKVEHAILIDCAPPKMQYPSEKRDAGYYLRRSIYLLRNGALFKTIHALLVRRSIRTIRTRFNLNSDTRHAIKYLWDAKNSYRVATHLDNHILIILNGDSREIRPKEKWNEVAPNAEIYFVEDTDHLDLFQSKRALDEVGRLINRYLEREK